MSLITVLNILIYMFSLGECVCNNGYIGFDCSMTLADAPKEISVPDEGLCGTKQRNCKKTNIFGEFHASNVYCKLEHFIVSRFLMHCSINILTNIIEYYIFKNVFKMFLLKYLLRYRK